jgi:Cu(I)/Ag(I) efflux system membrane fusion protein
MKNGYLAVVPALLLALGAGYWAGKTGSGAGEAMPPTAAVGTIGAPDAAAQKPRKLLYYRNPMGLPDTSPVPKKDSMGMDYIAVYEGEDDAASAPGEVKISTEKVQKLGVKSEAASLRELARQVTAVRSGRDRRAPRAQRGAEVRRLGRAPARQRHRPAGGQGPAAVRGV